MKYLWLIWLLVLIAAIALPGYIPSERNMTPGQHLLFSAMLWWMYGVPVVLIVIHVYRWIRQRAKPKE